jgi:hypothetical protein
LQQRRRFGHDSLIVSSAPPVKLSMVTDWPTSIPVTDLGIFASSSSSVTAAADVAAAVLEDWRVDTAHEPEQMTARAG